ncbi:MAG TPA: hypothetical protein VG267_18745 [Terracidiphilus sp.]|jgi:hypothetical protein|nr:hypothetical protein [Terracidiphilus sp.]
MAESTFLESIASRAESILPIVVLYNLRLSDSPTYRTFCAAARHCGSDPSRIAVYDNSPVRQADPEEEAHLKAFYHDPNNSGLAAGYNWALARAEESGIEWLLLLDQDSELPVEFLSIMLDAAMLYEPQPQVAAIVPHVRGSAGPISPNRVRFGRLAAVPETLSGVIPYEITAVNSGVLVRTDFVRSIGGFNPDFPLDCLDHWLFHEIYARGEVAAIATSCMRHDLSVRDYRNKVSVNRYRSILFSEGLFVATTKSRIERMFYVWRLALRAVKQVVIYRQPKIAALTGLMICSFLQNLARLPKGRSN